MKKELPQPLKTPSQSRSKVLYDSIIQAGAEILYDPDTEFTVRKVCERAGISMGSLYQYFPSKESVLSEIFKKVIDKEWLEVQKSFEFSEDRNLEEAILGRFTAGVKFLRQVYGLAPEFYSEYVESYLPYTPGKSNDDEMTLWVQNLEQQFARLLKSQAATKNFSQKKIEQITFLFCHASTAVMRLIISEKPEYILDDEFVELVGQWFAYLVAPE